MSNPFNHWDVVLGIGYGVFITMIVLKFLGSIGSAEMIVAYIIWMFALGLQTYRLNRQKRAAQADGGVTTNG